MEAMCGLVQTRKAADVCRYSEVDGARRGVHLLAEVGGVRLEPGVKIGIIGFGQGGSAASEAKCVG